MRTVTLIARNGCDRLGGSASRGPFDEREVASRCSFILSHSTSSMSNTCISSCSWYSAFENGIAGRILLCYSSRFAISNQAPSLRKVFSAQAEGANFRRTGDFRLTSGQCDRNGPPCGHCADAGVSCAPRTISFMPASDETDPDLEQLRLVPGEG